MSIITSVTEASLSEALTMALASPGGGGRAAPEHVRSFTHYLESCAIPWEGIRCERAGAVTGLALALLPPGRTAILLLPTPDQAGVREDDQFHATEVLLANLESHGLHYAQVLLAPGDSAVSRLITKAGFWHLAHLNYKDRDPSFPWVDPPTGDVSWIAYGPDTRAAFSATIEATYAASGDCPRLNGLRPIEDVMASHRATGKFDPELWQLGRMDDRNVGCLLLSRLTHGPVIELVYMGVVPDARRRHFGSIMLQRALELCRAARARRLTLVVDASNEAALRLYQRFDFQHVTARDAYLYQWSSKSASV